MILHIINQPIMTPPPAVSAGDAILLIENAVFAQLSLRSCDSGVKLYVLEADVKARGVSVHSDHNVIDYAGFVALCTEYDKVISW